MATISKDYGRTGQNVPLLDRYLVSFQSLADAFNAALLEIDDSVKAGNHYAGTLWRSIAVAQERKSSCCKTIDENVNRLFLNGVPDGLTPRLVPLLENDELSIKVKRIPYLNLYGLSVLLQLVDIHRVGHIFGLIRNLLNSSYSLPACNGNTTSAGGIIHVVTSVFGDAALHRSINPHPSCLQVHRLFIGNIVDFLHINTNSVNALFEGILFAMVTEIKQLQLACELPDRGSVFGISLCRKSYAAKTDMFLTLDRLVTDDEIKAFVSEALFSMDARNKNETQLLVNCVVVNDPSNSTGGISDLPYLFLAKIYYSWALSKPSSSNDLISTVLHGGQPPYALLFTSVFDDLSGLQSYLRLFESHHLVPNPNSIASLRKFYQSIAIAMTSEVSFDDLFDVSLTIIAFRCSIGPPFVEQEINIPDQMQLVRSIAQLFSSTSSALRALLNYGKAISSCSSRFIGSNEDTTTQNGYWLYKAMANFAARLSGFFGTDSKHCRTFPSADSATLANIMLTMASNISSESTQFCMTAMPSLISAVIAYAEMYWCSVATASILTNCPALLTTLAFLRHGLAAEQIDFNTTDVKQLSITQVVNKFMNYRPEKNKLFYLRGATTSYLHSLMKTNFHLDFAEMSYHVMAATSSSTPKPIVSPINGGNLEHNNSWLSISARMAKLSCVRSFSLTSSDQLSGSVFRKHASTTLGYHPALHLHLSNCSGCVDFALKTLKSFAFINPPHRFPSCFRPIIALSGTSALRCAYSPKKWSPVPPIIISQFWLPRERDVELVATPLDAVADTVVRYLSNMSIQGTHVKLLSFRFDVMNSFTDDTADEDSSCYEIPPVEVALPVAFRDMSGCATEFRRWWSISYRHRVFLRGVINMSQNNSSFLNRNDNFPHFLEFFIDIRPCFSTEAVTALRSFDRICHIFPSPEEYRHFKYCLINLSASNNSTVVGIGASKLENSVAMGLFFNFPFIPSIQQRLDKDIHNRYAVAMASSNWFEALLLAQWHCLLIPTTNDECNCASFNTELMFKNAENFLPLLRMPFFLKGIFSLLLYCRDSILLTLNISQINSIALMNTKQVEAPNVGIVSKCQTKASSVADESAFCKFERELLKSLFNLITSIEKRENNFYQDLFLKEPTGYANVVWSVAFHYVTRAMDAATIDGTLTLHELHLQWENIIRRYRYTTESLGKLAGLFLGFCDTISHYHLLAFNKQHQMIRRVSVSCVGVTNDTCPSLPNGIFRHDIAALTKIPVYD